MIAWDLSTKVVHTNSTPVQDQQQDLPQPFLLFVSSSAFDSAAIPEMFHTRASSSGIALGFYLFFHLAHCVAIPVPTELEPSSFTQPTATQTATSVLPTASGLPFQARIEASIPNNLASILEQGLLPSPSDNPIGDPFTISIKEPPGFPFTGFTVPDFTTGFTVPGSAETAISGAQTTTTPAFVVPGQSVSASKASKANVFTAILVSILVGATIFSVGS
ncbi:hypothetical protein K438DRAFT_1964555 [Mycena galopus ATCC 62051]|nr:hypothetical protein K438DRAFT_1964555 [Mycena galopus ATCC 62051]